MDGRSVRFEDGALVLDGSRRLLVAGDYPYYRDRPERWAGKLARMREAGIEVVTFYIPWRHHLVVAGDGSRRFVFSGGPGDNRNVLGFIEEVGRAGLLGLAKPGPFVHAEVQLGGLPDHLSPSYDAELEAVVSASGEPLRAQGLALPSAVSPRFREEAGAWLHAVAEQVLAGRLYPHGPLVGVQTGNEGLYSDAALALGAFDYSAPALRRFRSFLALRYGVIDALNAVYGTSLRSFGEVPPVKGWGGAPSLAAVLDWGEWCGRYLEEVLREWSAALGECPKLLNLPPPARGRLDAWLSRVRPERLRGLAYGFTSWVGNVLEDEAAFLGYVLAARRRRGPNLEENWGFSWSDARCVHPLSPAYHALLALAAGATGFSVYPACATDAWGPSIAVDVRNLEPEQARSGMYEPPYGGEAPISATGERGPKFETLSLMTGFLRHEGQELLACTHRAEVAWGLYAPYSHVAAWEPPAAERYRGFRWPRPSSGALEHLAADCLARGVDFRLVELESATPEVLASCPRILLEGGFFMSEAVQEKLAEYVERGGVLVVLGESPLFDERLRHCEILQERVLGHLLRGRESARRVEGLEGEVACRPLEPPEGAEPLLASEVGVHGYRVRRGEGQAVYLDVGVGPGVVSRALEVLGVGGAGEPGPRAFVSEYVGEEVSFLFVLGRGEAGVVSRTLRGVPLRLRLMERGCAVVKVRGGRLAGCFVKGLDELSGRGAPVWLRYGDEELSTEMPADVSAITVEERLQVRVASGGAPHPE